LLDEAQNTTPNQLKMFLTRLGPDSKMIITGDTSQVDLPKNQKSGLLHAIDTLKNVKGVSIVHLKPIDVVRHKIVKHIIEAYDAGE
jgi:phosphate starvation-inducible PhoH-like protein